jgi:hypothetical protein
MRARGYSNLEGWLEFSQCTLVFDHEHFRAFDLFGDATVRPSHAAERHRAQ